MIIGILKSILFMAIFYYCVKLIGDITRFIYFSKKKKENNENKETDMLKMIQCEKCKIYIPKSEAHFKDGKTFCKKEHEV